jgi:ubiquitin-conjugating enzyme E2 variant
MHQFAQSSDGRRRARIIELIWQRRLPSTIPFLAAAFAIPLSEPWGRAAAVYLVSFCLCGLPTNQVHQWAHRPQSPRWVDWLQRRGILLSREAHARHHAAPYVINYCITTGWCNALLSRLDFFRRFERLVTRVTGLKARGDDQAFAESVFAITISTSEAAHTKQ